MSPIEAIAYAIKEQIASIGPYKVLVFKEDEKAFHVRAFKSQYHIMTSCAYELFGDKRGTSTITVKFRYYDNLLKFCSFDIADPESSDELMKWVVEQFRM